jgi:hypothetical protein
MWLGKRRLWQHMNLSRYIASLLWRVCPSLSRRSMQSFPKSRIIFIFIFLNSNPM